MLMLTRVILNLKVKDLKENNSINNNKQGNHTSPRRRLRKWRLRKKEGRSGSLAVIRRSAGADPARFVPLILDCII